jgi:hypothetical protein
MRALLTKLGYIESGFIDNLDPGDRELVYFKLLHASETECGAEPDEGHRAARVDRKVSPPRRR